MGPHAQSRPSSQLWALVAIDVPTPSSIFHPLIGPSSKLKCHHCLREKENYSAQLRVY